MRTLRAPIIAILLALGCLELATAGGVINSVLIPPPSQWVRAMLEFQNDLLNALKETATAAMVGFLISSLLGMTLGLILFTSNSLKRSILPFAVFFQTVPIIAIAPLLVIYFGFGWNTVLTSSIIVSIFPILANTLIGLENTPPELLELFRLYNAGRLKTLLWLRWPQAYVSIYSGLRIAAGLSVIGAIAGEFVAGGGLGALIDVARTQQRIDVVFCCLILLSVLGLAILSVLSFTHQMLQKVRPFAVALHK